MKVPLEPIPTQQISTTRKETRKGKPSSANQEACGGPAAPSVSSPLNKAYPWLLGASVCLSGVLCWMYVTKPVIVSSSTIAPVAEQSLDSDPDTTMVEPVKAIISQPDLVPSSDALPGENPSLMPSKKPAIASSTGQNPLANAGVSWENTNLKVQHILRADTGNGEIEKIILDVPVRYETRTMRWEKEDIADARNILSQLMVYERDLNNLRQQGKSILKDWNLLLERTVPATVLRADSPSIPYNQGYGSRPQDLPASSSVIKVDTPKPSTK